MTAHNNDTFAEKATVLLEEICENLRAIRRVVNRILDQLHEIQDVEENDGNWDPDTMSWDDLENQDDMYS